MAKRRKIDIVLLFLVFFGIRTYGQNMNDAYFMLNTILLQSTSDSNTITDVINTKRQYHFENSEVHVEFGVKGYITSIKVNSTDNVSVEFNFLNNRLYSCYISHGIVGTNTEAYEYTRWDTLTGEVAIRGYANFIGNIGSEIKYYPHGGIKSEACYSCCLPNGDMDTTAICKKALYVRMKYDTISDSKYVGRDFFINSYYSNGIAERLWSYEIENKDTVFIETNFFESGKPFRILRYNNKLQLHGQSVMFNEQGILTDKQIYKNGIKVK